MELELELEKNYLEILNDKPSHNSQMLNKFIEKNTLNKLNFNIDDLVDLIANNLHNGYKPLYLGKTVEYTFFIEPNNTIKTFDGRVIEEKDIKQEVKDRVLKLYNNPIINNKDIEIIYNPRAKNNDRDINKITNNYFYVYGKFADEATKERWLYQYIHDLKQFKSNPLEKLNKNNYKLNILDKEFNLSFLQKDYGHSLVKLNKINNQYQQLKYIELLMKSNKIIIK